MTFNSHTIQEDHLDKETTAMYFEAAPTTDIKVVNASNEPVEDANTPIYSAMVSEYGDVLDPSADEELNLASEIWNESLGALKQVIRNAYMEKYDAETRGGHILV